ncbi:MAG: hypothetical protein CMM86_09310 [Rhodovulum sp.]|nr:hypothetical protein [Rhodovulum sp.]|tara:strand:- start:266 stop:649 length:384 start_codon:yes stop_codon:yes gene_type:complete
MGVFESAPRGGLREVFDGVPRDLILTNASIERFEDQHRGAFETLEAFGGRENRPSVTEVRDLIALGLIGAGMPDQEALAVVQAQGPGENMRLQVIAQCLLAVTFMPGLRDELEGLGDDAPPEPSKKK